MGLRETFARNININKDIRKRYQKLAEGFIFKVHGDAGKEIQLDMKYIFMICLALGYAKGKRIPVENSIGLINVDSFRSDELWAMASIAVKEDKNGIKILENGPEIKKIASEYAHAGLEELEALVDDYGTGKELMIALEKKAKLK